MTEAHHTLRRPLAQEITGLPEGLTARPSQAGDVEGITALVRAVDIAGCGHSSTNIEEITDYLADPECDWAYGSATVWRGSELVGVAFVFDGLATGRDWMIEVYATPGDPRAHGIHGSLIDGALREGRYRWDALYMDPEVPLPVAKTGCYVNDGALRADVEQRGFVEVRRFWRMKVDHWSVDGLRSGAAAHPQGTSAGSVRLPDGYTMRAFRDVDADWRGVHHASSTSFVDHFDSTPLDFDTWRQRHQGGTEDIGQWIVAEYDGQIVGFILGSNRFASEDCGFVASLGVLPEHRGRGVARALLLARMADDIERGLLSTILQVDATNPTGATALFESVGMVADSEFVGFQRPLFR
jgi:mycothiol synthase